MVISKIDKIHHYWYTFNSILEAGKSCIVIDGGNYLVETGDLIILTPKFPRRETKSQIKKSLQQYWAKREEEKQRSERRRENKKIRIDILFKITKAYNFQIPQTMEGINLLKGFLEKHSSFSKKNLDKYFENRKGKYFHILIGQPLKIKNGLEIDWDLNPTATSNVKSTPSIFNGIDISNLNIEEVEFADHIDIASTIKEFDELLNMIEGRKKIDLDKQNLIALTENDEIDPNIPDIIRILKNKKQVIVYGPPGTGKTRLAKLVAEKFTQNKEKIKFIQMHPNYSYVNFIEGLLPELDKNGNLNYEMKAGILKQIVKQANLSQGAHCLIIDEINRGNLQKIMGEAFYCLEYRGEDNSVDLASGSPFFIPENLYIIGTMNSADRSIADIDFALRRRFGFIEIKSDHGVIIDHFSKLGLGESKYLDALIGLFQHMNTRINELLQGESKSVGHSYFLLKDLEEESILDMIFYTLLPLLEDYFYHDKIEINSVMNYNFITGDLELRKIVRDELNLEEYLGRFEGE